MGADVCYAELLTLAAEPHLLAVVSVKPIDATSSGAQTAIIEQARKSIGDVPFYGLCSFQFLHFIFLIPVSSEGKHHSIIIPYYHGRIFGAEPVFSLEAMIDLAYIFLSLVINSDRGGTYGPVQNTPYCHGNKDL